MMGIAALHTILQMRSRQADALGNALREQKRPVI
jgi:hypothetical protein